MYQKLANDLGDKVKALLQERKQMLSLIHSLSTAYESMSGNVMAFKSKDTFVHKSIQTEFVTVSDGSGGGGGRGLSTLGGGGGVRVETIKVGNIMVRIPGAWQNLLKLSQKPGHNLKASTMPLPVLNRIVRELLTETRRVVRENPGKAMPDIVCEYFTQKFGLKSVAVTRLNDLVAAVVENQGASERARIFARLSGLSGGDYKQECVTLFCAAYDALDLYADGPNLNSRSWFDLGFVTRVVLGDCLLVSNRLFASGEASRNLSAQKLKEVCDRMVKLQNKSVTVNDIMPPKANRTAFLRYQKEKGKRKKENEKLVRMRYQGISLSAIKK